MSYEIANVRLDYSEIRKRQQVVVEVGVVAPDKDVVRDGSPFRHVLAKTDVERAVGIIDRMHDAAFNTAQLNHYVGTWPDRCRPFAVVGVGQSTNLDLRMVLRHTVGDRVDKPRQ